MVRDKNRPRPAPRQRMMNSAVRAIRLSRESSLTFHAVSLLRVVPRGSSWVA